MSATIYQLLYVSTATSVFDDATLEDILRVSRANNESLDITGMLLYHDGSILQLLEGEEEKVVALYQKIEQDPRHHSVAQLLDRRSSERRFEAWSMGFRRISDKEWSEVTGYMNESNVKEIASARDSDAILSFVKSFYQVNFR